MISPTTELEAINTMLSTIGEAPISTVEDSGVIDAVMARQILRTVDREVRPGAGTGTPIRATR